MLKIARLIVLAGAVSGCAGLADTERYCFDTQATTLQVGDSIFRDANFGCFMVRPMGAGDPVAVVDMGGRPAGRRGLQARRLYFWDNTNTPECNLVNAATVSITYSASRASHALVEISASNGEILRTQALTLDPRRGTRTVVNKGSIFGTRPSSVAINDPTQSIAVSKMCFSRPGWF